jgi:hypothetical protein
MHIMQLLNSLKQFTTSKNFIVCFIEWCKGSKPRTRKFGQRMIENLPYCQSNTQGHDEKQKPSNYNKMVHGGILGTTRCAPYTSQKL